MNPVPMLLGRRKMLAPRGDEKLKVAEHFLHHAGAPIVPVQNTIGGVAPADEG